MTGREEGRHGISGAFIFLLLGTFAVFCTVLVLLGVRAYRGGQEKAERHNEARLLSSYVRSMARSLDAAGALAIEHGEASDTLAFAEEYDEVRYDTRLYCHDGWLREMFAEEGYAFDPADGEAICEAASMRAFLEGGLLRVVLTAPDGSTQESVIALYAGGGL